MRRWGVLYFLLAIITMIFIYPLSDAGAEGAIIFQVIYCTFLTIGVYVTSQNRLQVGAAVVSAAAMIVNVIIVGNSSTTTDRVAVLVFGLTTTAFNLIMIWVLLAYIFYPERIVKDGQHSASDMIYSGAAVFLLLGYLFTPIYNVIETIQPGSFAFNTAPDMPITWQRLIYYSFATLTTTGYGDISAITRSAQSLAIVQSVTGVLYIAILMSRLVSLHMQTTQNALNDRSKSD